MSGLFTVELPFVGRVPMCKFVRVHRSFAVFFVPICKPRSKIKDAIESNGGLVVPELESGVMQISPA